MNINLVSSENFMFSTLLWRYRYPISKNSCGVPNTTVNLKHIALHLCTCTWIEIMTGAGIILYMLYLGNYTLAAITVAEVGPLIGMHLSGGTGRHLYVEEADEDEH